MEDCLRRRESSVGLGTGITLHALEAEEALGEQTQLPPHITEPDCP